MAFLKKNNLNQAQFILMYFLYHKEYDLLQQYKDMFPTEDGSAIGRGGLADLIKRGFLVDVKPDDPNAISLKLTDKFTHIYADKYVIGSELWEAYPSFVINGGRRFPLTLTDEDELRETYYKKIKGMREEHEEIMLDLEYAKENNLIQGTIKNFVLSRQWNTFRKERLNSVTADTNILKRERF